VAKNWLLSKPDEVAGKLDVGWIEGSYGDRLFGKAWGEGELLI
jgi:hypothetical protein